jgi:PPOX class probable F420-dependent enzyme
VAQPGEGLRARVADWPVARLATVGPDGAPHLVPCCFALDGDVVYSAVDAIKPKRSLRLRRLDDVRANPAVCLLVDHYTDDWSQLWWVRLDGRGRVVEDGPERNRAIELLCAKYRQYQDHPPAGAVLALEITRWRAWSGATG